MIDNSLIYVSVITRHTGHWSMFQAFQNAAGYAMKKGYRCMLAPHVGDSLVSRARNNCLADFLQTDAGWFFTLDDDIAIPQETFPKLVECNLPIVGNPYLVPLIPDYPWAKIFQASDTLLIKSCTATAQGHDPFTRGILFFPEDQWSDG